MRRTAMFLALLTMTACNASRSSYVAEADTLTNQCARTSLATWHVRASAAGDDCDVLLLETDTMILEDAMVDAMHHGSGAYDMFEGGLQRYSEKRSFRGVAYRDKSGRIWRYGELSETEVLQPCH